jgi:hypothetical protein
MSEEILQLSRVATRSTVRIEVARGSSGGQGTGFYYTFQTGEEESKVIPVVVTCWHVVEGASRGALFFAEGGTNLMARGGPATGVFDDFEKLWIRHPDTNVDLAILPIASVLRRMEAIQKHLNIASLNAKVLASSNELWEVGAIAEVKFVGYPIGLWDEKNNLPISRRGVTATDPAIDYNGRRELLIDAAVYPGSSGSPVFLLDEGFIASSGGLTAGSRVRLLGILAAVHQYTADGELEIVKIPAVFDAHIRSNIPANLGVVIKAERLTEFYSSPCCSGKGGWFGNFPKAWAIVTALGLGNAACVRIEIFLETLAPQNYSLVYRADNAMDHAIIGTGEGYAV